MKWLILLSSYKYLKDSFLMSDQVKILIAEDNDFVRAQIVQFLSIDAYQLIEANDGNQALDVVCEDDVDIAIVDVRMEPMDGFEFIQKIRGKEINIPVILVTGDNDPDLLSRSNEWGVSAVLIKPVEKDRLLMTVERLLSKRAG